MKVELENSHPSNHHHHHRKRRRNEVIVVVNPLQGHISPMLHLATLLYSKGLSITIAYPLEFIPPNTFTQHEFTYLPLKADDASVIDWSRGFMGFTTGLNKGYKESFEKGLSEKYFDDEGDTNVGCVVYDNFMYFAQDVADFLKIPGISMPTSSVATILGLAVHRGSHEFRCYDMPVQVSMETLLQDPELQTLELDNLIKGSKVTEEMFEVRAEVIKAMSNSKAIIVNTMDFFECAAIQKAQEYFLGPIYPIGPLHKIAKNPSSFNSLLNEDSTCIAWLDKKPTRSVLYVSFGSLVTITEEDLIEIAMGLAQSDQPFLWVVRPKSIHGGREWAEILPHSLKERIQKMGFIVSWAPQRQVLAHSSIGGFWTHCGWNSTLESVSEGVPMICKPFIADQYLNAKYISKVWKIGLELEDRFEKENIEITVRRLMVGDEGDKIRKMLFDLKEKVDFCLEESGSSPKFLNQLTDLIKSI